MPSAFINGTVEISTSSAASTIAQRWFIDQRSSFLYGTSKRRKRNVSLVSFASPGLWTVGFRKREHNMGVRVKLTSSDTMMAKAAV